MFIKKVIKDWVEKLYGGATNIREKLFCIILILGLMIASIGVIASFFVRSPLIVFVPLVLNEVAIGLGIYITYKYRKMNLAAFVMGILINMCLFPVMFFVSGGIESGATIWFVLGLVYVFLLFSGKHLYIMLALTCASDLVTYYLAYQHPEWVIPMTDTTAVFMDSFQAVILVGFTSGVIFKFYDKLYEKERQITKKQKEEVERINQSKSAFFANMSHEIRTPINTIIGLNEMILREKDISEEVAENAVNIQNASRMLLALINDILDLSKIESGKMEIVPVQYETGAMFSDLVNIIWIRAHEKNLEFKLDIDPNIPSMLYGDEVRLRQVVTNILTNAVKYTESGSVTLSAKSERINGNTVRLRISVEDTGIGIKKESLEELFASFKRVDQARNRKIEGTGLGLSISKQLIEMMGGQITVDSIYQTGSIFTITVEQQIVNSNPVGSLNLMAKKKLYDRDKYKQSFEAPDAKVLIVDDNEMNLMVACKLLRATKVQIDTAKSGKECLEKTRSKSYHVIFMDHMMPKMDGEEALHEVRKQENGRCKETPVIALTANVMTGAEQIYRDKGFEGYLAKPINGPLFEATLLKYLPEELIEYNVEDDEEEGADDTIQIISMERKRKVRVTTDCVCDLPKEWMERFDIKNMYYYVYTKEGRFCDISEISSDNLLKYLEKEENMAHSSPASVEEYESFFAGALRDAEKVIHISMAARSSEGYEKASMAADGFDNVTVIDSGHLSSGMGIMVLYAAKMAQDGHSVEEICSELAELKNRISTTFIVGTPDNLYRNGRMSKGVRDLCHAMNLHPVLHLAQSKIKVQGIIVGKKDRAYKKYIKEQLQDKKKIDPSILFLTYAGCSVKQLKEIEKEVNKYVNFEYIQWQKASATISSNCGIGAFGLLFMKAKK